MYYRSKYALPIILGILFYANAAAEVVVDGNLSLEKDPTTQVYDITENFGQVSGDNLYHSFNAFNIATGETASFSGSNNIKNIISRVSGTSPSVIDGTIRSTINGANLWLLNSNGVLFGQTASLNITGSFYASTANYLKFDNGDIFNADSISNTDTFSIASPESYGFTSAEPAAVVVNGATLQVNDNHHLSLVGGSVNIHQANILASSGGINILAAAGTGIVPVTGSDIEIGVADINITETTINVGGTSNQGIAIIGGKLVISDSSISEDSNSSQSTASINIKGENTVLSNTNISAFQQSQVSIISDQLTIRETNNTDAIQASLNINQLDVLVDEFSGDNFSGLINSISPDGAISISINGELQNAAQNSIVAPIVNETIDNEATENSDLSVVEGNTESQSSSNINSIILSSTSRELEIEFTSTNKTTDRDNKSINPCELTINNTLLSTRPVLFQPMPGEFNPGRLYQYVDLAVSGNQTSSSPTLGIFNQCS